jgi:hypothetical protein
VPDACLGGRRDGTGAGAVRPDPDGAETPHDSALVGLEVSNTRARIANEENKSDDDYIDKISGGIEAPQSIGVPA